MQCFAAFVDDAAHAMRSLSPVLDAAAGATHCVVVLCPPRLNRRMSRFTPSSARQAWRADWADALKRQLAPALAGAAPAVTVTWEVATGDLPAVARTLRLRHGAGLRLLDARAQRLGRTNPPLVAGQAPVSGRMAAPVAVASSLSLMLALTD